jgi:hypothetical protein
LNLLFKHVDIVVQTEEEEQATHVVSATEIALQSYGDSQPLAALESLLYFPAAHAETVVQAEEEQTVHVASVKIALQLNDDSQPLIGRESLSNLLLAQVEIAVHVEEDEQAVHVV